MGLGAPDHRYGSPKEPIKEALRAGRDILFDIDWQGTAASRRLWNRPRTHLHPPAIDDGAERRLQRLGVGTDPKKSSKAVCGARPVKSATGANTTTF